MDPSIPQSEKLVLMQELTAKVDLREYRMEEDRLALATEKYRHIVTSPEEGGHTSARHPPHHLPALLRGMASASSSCPARVVAQRVCLRVVDWGGLGWVGLTCPLFFLFLFS
jgi:hypothetical protein